MARILFGVTGGIAAYKACEALRLLVRAGHDVLPLPTPGAERFVTAETFFALARKPRTVDPYPHLERADALVVAPLSANTLAKLAHGLADNVLTEAALAHRGPLVLAPAMNTRMWEHPATQANLALVQERGALVVGPGVGELAEGEVGAGRMAEPAEIAAAVEEALSPRVATGLAGKHLLVTAGGTREPVDAVRFLGNRSSGRMGLALAAEAQRRGADVTLLAANVALPAPPGVELVETPTAAALHEAVATRAEAADVVVMAAAVADYRPVEALADKRPKGGERWTLELEPTVDILRELGERHGNGRVLVGFGAEVGRAGLERKRAMLNDKKVDLVVYNDIGRDGIGFDSPDNEVVLLTERGEREVPKGPKETIAAAVLDEVERLLTERADRQVETEGEERHGSA